MNLFLQRGQEMRFIWELIARISFRSASEVIQFMWTLKVQWRAQSFLVPGWFIFSLDIEGHHAHGPAAPKLVTSESPKLINLPLTTIHLDNKLVFCYKICKHTHQYNKMRPEIIGIKQSRAIVGIGKMMVKNTMMTNAPMVSPIIVSM